ncbi:hypothetical protein T4D_2403 [Trichinella pseudospiralis]|uniref:Uncharacterized protein n=1 Tax=Trichinella pseudospiralis TaxID=6337 RepID=A0A0V1FP66_TRIPS|nr:hypothetical protein T4D_2403 [Trichinella pseudospiralis]
MCKSLMMNYCCEEEQKLIAFTGNVHLTDISVLSAFGVDLIYFEFGRLVGSDYLKKLQFIGNRSKLQQQQ